MSERPEDICPRPDFVRPFATRPLAPPLYTSAVYQCESPAQADAMLARQEYGYVYSRDAHPNRDLLADKCRELHEAQEATIGASGMSVLAAAALAVLTPGDETIVSDQLYGRSIHLFASELPRYGVTSQVLDTCDLNSVRQSLSPRTKLIVVETITNPLLKVSDLSGLAELAHSVGALLLVDNTFAGPTICRPLTLGADLVIESLTKIMNGHSDVLLGLLCGHTKHWERVPQVMSTWGLAGAPFDCWLALRGLSTLALRAERASVNALAAAEHLRTKNQVSHVYYPGLSDHPDHALAKRQFTGGFGSIVTFDLAGGRVAAEQFIRAAQRIPFCPSLGDLSTTLSHPESTSHRSMTAERRAQLGITGGTIRVSVGIESAEAIRAAIDEGLRGIVT